MKVAPWWCGAAGVAGAAGAALAIGTACTSDPRGDASQAGLPIGRSESDRVVVPSDPMSLAQSLGVAPESLRAAGEERYRHGAYDSAQAIWRVEIRRAGAAADSAGEARARMWLGLAAWKLTDYPTARAEGERSLALKRRLHLDAELSRSFNALGLLAWNEGRHRDALQHFDSAMASARRHADTAGVARAAGNVPLVRVELGDFDGARRWFDSALVIGRALEDDQLQGNLLANLAMLDVRLGQASQAVPLLMEARKRYATIEYADGEANALGQLATAWSQLGDLQRALAAADSGLAIARATGLQQEVAATLEVVADLHVQAGNLQLALRRLREADSLDAALGLLVERGTNQRRLASILTDLGEAPVGVRHAREALLTHRKTEARAEEVRDRLQLAQSLARSGDTSAARAEADSASRGAASLGNPVLAREAAAVAARLALDAGNPARALSLMRAAAASRSSADWRLDDLRAEALLALGRLEDARRAGVDAVAGVERERGSLGQGASRSAYLGSRVAPFSHLVAIHLARGDTAEAFRVAASLPGRSLSERLSGVTDVSTSIASVARGEALLRRVAALEQAISEVDAGRQHDDTRNALVRALEAARAAYEEQLSNAVASPGARTLGVTAMSARDVRVQLTPDEALLLYLVGPERLDIFVVQRDSLRHHSVPIGSGALGERVRLVRQLLLRGGRRSDASPALAALHDLLIKPVLGSRPADGVSRLIIVPHGPLGALPFAALTGASNKFLVEDYVLTYLPTVSALAAGRSGVTRANRLAVFVPLPESLPGTRREGQAIARLVPGARLWLGGASTEQEVRSALTAADLVHIASHGTHNAQNPLFSVVRVGRPGRPGRGDGSSDGRLEVHEILGLRTSSSLVFLSGCETGLGSAGTGPFAAGSDEGSLAQAFLSAGAQSVVATLWKVDDAGAVHLAEVFYERLGSGVAPNDALAQAQRAGIRADAGYTWAAYTVSGIAARQPIGMAVATHPPGSRKVAAQILPPGPYQ